MKLYRVIKNYPKSIVNNGKFITLRPGLVLQLRRDGQVSRLMRLGYLVEVQELHKTRVVKIKEEPVEDIKESTTEELSEVEEEYKSKKHIKKTKANKQKDAALEESFKME